MGVKVTPTAMASPWAIFSANATRTRGGVATMVRTDGTVSAERADELRRAWTGNIPKIGTISAQSNTDDEKFEKKFQGENFHSFSTKFPEF